MNLTPSNQIEIHLIQASPGNIWFASFDIFVPCFSCVLCFHSDCRFSSICSAGPASLFVALLCSSILCKVCTALQTRVFLLSGKPAEANNVCSVEI